MPTHIGVRISALAVSVLALIACGSGETYRGDGRLIDNGPLAATDRYVLVLGPVRLERMGTTSYQMEGLPVEKFALGINLTRPQETTKPFSTRPVDAIVALELRDEKGTIVFRREGALNEWTWNIPATDEWAFVYGREAPTTFFTPKDGSLKLTFAVLKPDPSAIAYVPVLAAKAGGWK